jgi:predicted TIM-barrel fold metal-dependent hydrolase
VTVIDAHVVLEHDTSAADVLAAMDEQRIDVSLLSPADDEIAVRNREGNDRVLAIAAADPQRLRAYAVANPWFGADAARELDRALTAGACAFKINASLQGFLLLDQIIDPLVQVAQDHGVPVYAHTGTPVHALPLQLAELASRFPDVAFVMGRSGRPDFRTDAPTALQLAPNLYADTSHDYGVTGLTNMYQSFGAGRMVFCSDHPYATRAEGRRAVAAIDMNETDRAAVLGGTMAGLLPASDTQGGARVR